MWRRGSAALHRVLQRGVLAAGEGRRMGRPKAGILLKGKTLLEHTVHSLRCAGCVDIVAVLILNVLVNGWLAYQWWLEVEPIFRATMADLPADHLASVFVDLAAIGESDDWRLDEHTRRCRRRRPSARGTESSQPMP